MAILIPFLVIAVFCILLERNRRRVEEEMEDEEIYGAQKSAPEASNALNEPDTRGLMQTTLCNLGCQPMANEDGSLDVQYQGEKFHIEFSGYFAQIWDLYWASVEVDDPGFPTLRDAINVSNYNYGPTVVLTHPDEQNRIFLHSRNTIMLHPSFPDKEDYVQAVLGSFFSAKEDVRDRYQQISSTQTEPRENRRPVGFETSAE